jgi:hypothetical protein
MCTSISGARSSAHVKQLTLAVALSHNGFQVKLVGFVFDQLGEFVVCGAAVDLGFATAEPTQVGTVQHKHGLKSHDVTAAISE